MKAVNAVDQTGLAAPGQSAGRGSQPQPRRVVDLGGGQQRPAKAPGEDRNKLTRSYTAVRDGQRPAKAPGEDRNNTDNDGELALFASQRPAKAPGEDRNAAR